MYLVLRAESDLTYDRAMFAVFCVLQSLVVGLAWVVLIWAWIAQPPLVRPSGYPLFDFATRARFTGDGTSIAAANGAKEIRKALRTAKVVPHGRQQNERDEFPVA